MIYGQVSVSQWDDSTVKGFMPRRPGNKRPSLLIPALSRGLCLIANPLVQHIITVLRSQQLEDPSTLHDAVFQRNARELIQVSITKNFSDGSKLSRTGCCRESRRIVRPATRSSIEPWPLWSNESRCDGPVDNGPSARQLPGREAPPRHVMADRQPPAKSITSNRKAIAKWKLHRQLTRSRDHHCAFKV